MEVVDRIVFGCFSAVALLYQAAVISSFTRVHLAICCTSVLCYSCSQLLLFLFFPSKWTCVLNVIRTLDASTENAFVAEVIKGMAFPARKVSVEMMAGDQSPSLCNGPFEKWTYCINVNHFLTTWWYVTKRNLTIKPSVKPTCLRIISVFPINNWLCR